MLPSYFAVILASAISIYEEKVMGIKIGYNLFKMWRAGEING